MVGTGVLLSSSSRSKVSERRKQINRDDESSNSEDDSESSVDVARNPLRENEARVKRKRSTTRRLPHPTKTTLPMIVPRQSRIDCNIRVVIGECFHQRHRLSLGRRSRRQRKEGQIIELIYQEERNGRHNEEQDVG
jgi:hypothetical protein